MPSSFAESTLTTVESDKDVFGEVESKKRQFDVVIFGASGTVGQYLVEELALVVDKHYSAQETNDSTLASTSNTLRPQIVRPQVSRKRSVPSSLDSNNSIDWAIAGRSAIKLSETLCRAELSTGIKNLSNNIEIILADLQHEKSLFDMCNRTKLIINCAGPYTELGAESLIKTCIECRTNYIDLSHEITFNERIRRKYSQAAKRAHVYVLNGCGFQSMSAEMGLNFTKQVADGRIEQVKIILSLSDTNALVRSPARTSPISRGLVSSGMWNSLLADKAQEMNVAKNGLQQKQTSGRNSNKMNSQQHDDNNEYEEEEISLSDDINQQQQQQQMATMFSSAKHSYRIDTQTKILERQDTQSLVREIVQYRNRHTAWPLQLIHGFQSRRGRGYCWPVDGLTSDEFQLIRSEMNEYELRRPDVVASDNSWRPIQCSSFLSLKSFTQLCVLFVWLLLFRLLVKNSLMRYMMRKLPHLASLGHVNSSSTGAIIQRDSLSHVKFCQTFIAFGTPGDESGDPLELRNKHLARKQTQLLVCRVVGPEPNRVATATFAIQAAITLLMEQDHLPRAGVLTPGAAFCETNIIYQLRRRNIKFEVLKKA